jgi:hypothetical protein
MFSIKSGGKPVISLIILLPLHVGQIAFDETRFENKPVPLQIGHF